MDRRSFVRECVALGLLGATGATGGLAAKVMFGQGAKTVRVRYVGAKVAHSPAPRALPMIPLRVNERGEVEGVPSHLDWYKYCGRERLPGLSESYGGDNVLRYHASTGKLSFVLDDWYKGLVGHVVRVADIPLGRGAPVRWRSENVAQGQEISGVVLRLPPDEYRGPADGVVDGVSCFCTFCTHFCCVPGWREVEVAPDDKLHCTCHGSQFDPRRLVEDEFWMRVVEEEKPA